MVFWPLIPTPNSGPNNWFATPSLPTHWREELFRVDQNISDKVRATFRYIHDSWNQDYPVPLWTSGITFPTDSNQLQWPGRQHGGACHGYSFAHAAE